MSPSKVVVVFGATGNQGGSVIKAIQNDPRAAQEFKLRGITRDPSKPSAKALEAQGVECVTGDLESKDSLRQALKGAYAVFAVTNYWESLDDAKEEQQGKNVADVCKELGVEHLIWSSLLDAKELSKGKYKEVLHFDTKARVEKHIRSIGQPATFLLAGTYMSNMVTSLVPNPHSEVHEYVLALPIPVDTKLPFFDVADDTGKFVKAILLNRSNLLGKQVLASTAYYTPQQLVEEFTAAKPVDGKGAHAAQVPGEVWKGFLAKAGLPEKAQIELLEMYEFMAEYGYYGGASLDESLAILSEKPTTWTEFIHKTEPFKSLK